MNTGQRLVQLSGLGSNTAGTHLLAIGTGATAGALLVSHSGLGSNPAYVHLLADPAGGAIAPLFLILARRIGRR